MRESNKAIRFAFWIARLALYMILASQFNSFSQPAIIMLAAPLSFAGALARPEATPIGQAGENSALDSSGKEVLVVRVEDARGRVLSFHGTPRRIVCLVPSITETLFALGAGERVVGVTDFCVHPREKVATRSKVGGTKNPQLARVLELRPDLVIANREENRLRDVERLEAAGVSVLVTYPRDIESALGEIELLGRLLVAGTAADALVCEVRDALAEAEARVAEPIPAVVALIWKRPYMTLNKDTFAHDLLTRSGGRNPFADRERRYPIVKEAEIEEAAPQVVLLPTEPYAFDERDRQELLRLRCPAAEAGRVHLVEGELLSWYGPRMGRALRTFSALLHS